MTYQTNFTGDAGRQRLGLSSINLHDRNGLHGRPHGARCPVLWMQGTADPVYSVANAQDEIKRFPTPRTPSFGSFKVASTSQRLEPR